MNDKVKNAGVGDWKDQKLTKFSFFEMQKNLFLDKTQIEKTFKGVDVDYSKFRDYNVAEFEEEALPKDMSQELKDYMEKKGIELEESYLKNGLSKEEVELRKKTYGPNALPEPKKTPAIILFLEEISNYFSILLWIAAALSFVGYGLSPADYSNSFC